MSATLQALESSNAQRWHALSAENALEHYASSRQGLSSDEAQRRLSRHGRNRLPAPPRRSAFLRLLLQFHNVLIYILVVAAGVTAVLGHYLDSAVILSVVLVNALIGFVQEGKAETALESIRRMLSLSAMVLRNGQRVELEAEELVPGDIVIIGSGDKVPADLRLLAVRNLRIDEAALTGESVPTEKSVGPVAPDVPLGDRACMAYSGTVVTFGQGTGVVVATASATEIGRISHLLAQVEELTTPLLRQMAGFGRWLSAAIVLLAAAVFAFGYWVKGYSASDMFLAAIGLAVAAIPEGLPAIMTITLAIGVQRMAQRNAIIRRLPAVETLGSVTTICSDKTGTLTRNEMTVTRIAMADAAVEVGGVGYAPHGGLTSAGREITIEALPALRALLRGAALCNDARLRQHEDRWEIEGDPTEGALITLAMKAGLEPGLEAERFPRTDVIPFESEHRFMATLHHDHAGHGRIFVKGAPERVLEMCTSELRADEELPIERNAWESRMHDMANDGLRLLAVAAKPCVGDKRELALRDVDHGLTLLGVLGIIDPPRAEAIASVRDCYNAGIRVTMITGDHLVTARAIAAQLGLRAQHAMGGPQIDELDVSALSAAVRDVSVFARASPEHKLKLVQALQANGEVVAMTGDGVNDAPALKRADVGVAMGRKGTEAAKEAAEMVLADDNFTSIAHAVEEGRTVYDNLKKAILFILPTNGGEAGVIIVAIALGLTLPITAVQILWVNMVTSVTLALAVAFEPPESDVMRRRPRNPRDPILSRFLVWRIAFVSVLLASGTLGLFLFELQRGESLEAARTGAVNALVIGELFYLFNSRFLFAPVFNRRGMTGNRAIWIAVGILIVLQIAFTHVPSMQVLFGSTHLDLDSWLLAISVGIGVCALVELEKAMARRWNHASASRLM